MMFLVWFIVYTIVGVISAGLVDKKTDFFLGAPVWTRGVFVCFWPLSIPFIFVLGVSRLVILISGKKDDEL